MQGIYELGLTCTYPIPLGFHNGMMGGSNRCAWNHGYEGLNITRYSRNSIAYAAFVAGKEVKKIDSKKSK